MPTSALLLVGHGSDRLVEPGRLLERQARAVGDLLSGVEVHAIAVNGHPIAADVLPRVRAPQRIVVPMCMADGYLARTQIPALIFGTGDGASPGVTARFTRPLGLLPGLDRVVERRARTACASAGLDPRNVTLVLAAHGSSKGTESRTAAERMADMVRRQGTFAGVATGYLEEGPFLVDTLTTLEGAVVVDGFFAGTGAHVSEDVPRIVASSGNRHVVAWLGSIGADPAVSRLIEAAVLPLFSRAPALSS